jgi:hypothetical protein
MKKIILLLCLGFIGCATVTKESKTPPQVIRELVAVNEIELDSVISVFSQAIKKNPGYSGAYYNRAVAYFYKKDYQKCWQDVRTAQSLGFTFSDDFLVSLKKASNREE